MQTLTSKMILIAALAAAACRGPAAPEPTNEPAEMMRGCDEALRQLRRMATADPRFDFDVEGNARFPKALWESLPSEMQDGLIKAVAYQALCTAGEMGTQQVTVRSSENNEVLAERTVSDFERPPGANSR